MKKACLVALAAICVATGLFTAAASAATPGKIVFVSNRDGDDEIFVMNSDGSAQTQLTSNVPIGGGSSDRDPFWSPNGKQIGFFSDRASSGNRQLWVMDANGANPRQVTFLPNGVYSGDWSPDGRTIVFVQDLPMTDNIFVINVNGTGLRQLTFDTSPATGGPFGPHFSPRGTHVAFTNNQPSPSPDALALIPFAGGNFVNLTSISAFAPDFTGDARRILFYSDESTDGGTDWELFTVAIDGTDLRQVTANTVDDDAPSPSRDGLNRIAFRINDGDNEIAVMNADGSGRAQLTVNTFNDRGPDWQPNVKCGKGIATIVGTSASETLSGGPGPDTISGQGGKDKIKGLGGKDVICGDKGRDNLNGGKGRDVLFGGKGRDKTIGGKGKDRCVGGKGDDSGKGCEKEKSL